MVYQEYEDDGLPPFEDLMQFFLRTPRMQEIYQEALSFVLDPESTMGIGKYAGYFSGAMFETIAHSFITSTKNPRNNFTIYSPTETFEFFKTLYPKRRIAEFPFGAKTLAGVSVPDGLLFDNAQSGGKLMGLYEYTNRDDLENFRRKYNMGLPYFRKEHPNIFDRDCHVIFVVAQDVKMPDDLVNNSDFGLIKLPFTHSAFGSFSKRLLTTYRPSGGASLLEIQRRVKGQMLSSNFYYPD